MAFATSPGGNIALFPFKVYCLRFVGSHLEKQHVSDMAKKMLPIVVQKQKGASWHVPLPLCLPSYIVLTFCPIQISAL